MRKPTGLRRIPLFLLVIGRGPLAPAGRTPELPGQSSTEKITRDSSSSSADGSGTGLSRVTVRRYVEAAEAAGLTPGGPEPSEEQLAALATLSLSGPRPAEAPSEELLSPWAERIERWLTADRLQLTRIQELLAGRGCEVSYTTLRRFIRRRGWRHRQPVTVRALASAVQVRARAQQQLVWNRTRESNRLRSALLQYFPAALQAFPDLAHADALSVLAVAPEPLAAAKLTRAQLRAALRRGGRKRNLDTRTEEIHEKLRLRTLHVAPALSQAFADSVLVQVGQLQEINRQLEGLESKLAASTD